jgi:AcrR family transcriptional regulator
MTRTVGSDGMRTEAAIRRAAIDLIAAHGFESVTLRSLAKLVGVQPGSLYRYYPSKNDLLLRIIILHLDDLHAQWEKVRPASPTALDRLSAFIEFHIRYHLARPKEVFIANMEMRSLPTEGRKHVVELRKRYEGIVHGILQEGVQEGAFSIPDTHIATFAIIAMLTGLTSWYQDKGRLTKEQIVEFYKILVTSGVARCHERGSTEK